MRHAFLIMAHQNFEILHKMILLLDDDMHDFYIHIDQKNKHFDKDMLLQNVTKSKVYFVERKRIYWGGWSMIACTLALLSASVKKEYDYYHLLSGADFPIKTKAQIQTFFDQHKGKEFILFRKKTPDFERRVQEIYFFPTLYRKYRLYQMAHKALLFALKRRRFLYDIHDFAFGANWFSITHPLAKQIVKEKQNIKKQYTHSYCADEIFVQTLVKNSAFSKNVYGGVQNNAYSYVLRKIDWEKGNPYVYQMQDVEALLKEDACFLFARKFEEEQVVEKIYQRLKKE